MDADFSRDDIIDEDMHPSTSYEDADGDILTLYVADEDPDYLVLLQENYEDPGDTSSGVTTSSLAFHKDDVKAIIRDLQSFVSS